MSVDVNQHTLVSRPVPPLDLAATAAFHRRVNKGPTCWFWTGGKRSTSGYGVFRVIVETPYGRAGVNVAAHRISYVLTKGQIPAGAILLHSCDQPACVNPDHLRAGTPKENAHEALSRGRRKRHWATKLSDADVTELRHLYFDAKMTVGALAARCLLSKPAMSAMLTGRTHRMVPGPVGPIRKVFGPSVHGAKMDEASVAALRGRYLAGETIYDLATEFGLAPQTVSNITRNKTWKHVAPIPPNKIRRGHRKLTKEQVTKIRQRHSAGASQARIARDYHVSHATISLLVNRRTHA